jgi:hypothetical protein
MGVNLAAWEGAKYAPEPTLRWRLHGTGTCGGTGFVVPAAYAGTCAQMLLPTASHHSLRHIVSARSATVDQQISPTAT